MHLRSILNRFTILWRSDRDMGTRGVAESPGLEALSGKYMSCGSSRDMTDGARGDFRTACEGVTVITGAEYIL